MNDPHDNPRAVSGDTGTSATELDETYEWAHERAEMIQGLYIHLMVFVVVNAGLFVINWATRGDGSWWFQWPLLIWGLALAVHVLVTFVPVFSTDWADRRAEQIASRQHHTASR